MAQRNHNHPDNCDNNIGFRVARGRAKKEGSSLILFLAVDSDGDGIEKWSPFDKTLRNLNDTDNIKAAYELDDDGIQPELAGKQVLADAVAL